VLCPKSVETALNSSLFKLKKRERKKGERELSVRYCNVSHQFSDCRMSLLCRGQVFKLNSSFRTCPNSASVPSLEMGFRPHMDIGSSQSNSRFYPAVATLHSKSPSQQCPPSATSVPHPFVEPSALCIPSIGTKCSMAKGGEVNKISRERQIFGVCATITLMH